MREHSAPSSAATTGMSSSALGSALLTLHIRMNTSAAQLADLPSSDRANKYCNRNAAASASSSTKLENTASTFETSTRLSNSMRQHCSNAGLDMRSFISFDLCGDSADKQGCSLCMNVLYTSPDENTLRRMTSNTAGSMSMLLSGARGRSSGRMVERTWSSRLFDSPSLAIRAYSTGSDVPM